jgi:hypothetical protein
MNKKQKFEKFLEGLKGHNQDALIESVKKGFRVCYESDEAWFSGDAELTKSDEPGIDYVYYSSLDHELLNDFFKTPEIKDEIMKEFKEKFNSEPEAVSLKIGIENANPKYESGDSSVGVSSGAYMEYDDAYLKVIFSDENGNKIEKQFPPEYWPKVIYKNAPLIRNYTKEVYDNLSEKLDAIANGHYEDIALSRQIDRYEDRLDRGE